jgi:hypothetical protein
MASNDRPTVADMVGIWKDAFPEGIDSVEIICPYHAKHHLDVGRVKVTTERNLPDGPYLIARYRLNR